jgi:formylglycine-generating enzyme required for sulfatase activity
VRLCPYCKQQIPNRVHFCPYCARRLRYDWQDRLNQEMVAGLFLGLMASLWLVVNFFDLLPNIILSSEVTPVTRMMMVTRQVTATHPPRMPTPTPTTAALTQPAATRMAPTDGATQLLLPAGHFYMGTADEQFAATAGLWPRRTIFLEPFWIDRLEVTNGKFAIFLNASGNQLEEGAAWLSLSESRIVQEGGEFQAEPGYEEHPVTFVNWYGAAAYCQWAGRRLPTDAEWEKAARGSSGLSYPWGDEEPTCQSGNYAGCAGGTMSSGSYPVDTSPYGAMDMFGNVSEWVNAWEGDEYWNTAVESTVEPSPNRLRVVRGGGWTAEPFWGLTFYRGSLHPTLSGDGLGFRCAEDGE